MPIYEYDCKVCHCEFEALVSSSRTPKCPDCGSSKLSKKFSAFAVQAAPSAGRSIGPCGTCGDPRGSGACGLN